MSTMHLTAPLVILFVGSITAYKDNHHDTIKERIGEHIKSAAWKSLGWNAELDGSAVVSVIQKYRVPLKTILKGKGYLYNHRASNCLEIKTSRKIAPDGVYTIYLDGGKGVDVYCDMTTDGGGWTVFQRRFDGSVDFYRGWADYKTGFGDPKGEYWLGNDAIHKLTEQGNCTLRIDMVTLQNEAGYAEYSGFTIGSEQEGYVLNYTKYLVGVGDSLSYHKGMKFSTKDNDNDGNVKRHCATEYTGAWWYKNCHHSNLNGKYGGSSTKNIRWYPWQKSDKHMRKTKLMIRC